MVKADTQSVAQAAAYIRAGEVVAFPTETVYGLGADALNAQAVHRIFEAKGRPADNPLIVHIAALDQLDALVTDVPEAAWRLIEAFWPGPMTLILPKRDCIPDVVSAGLSTVGIRFPSHPVAQELIRRSGCPIAAPSANRSGRPSPTRASHVLEDMQGRIPMILDGGPCAVGLESSVIDVTGGTPVVLRPGGVTPEMVARAAGGVRVDEHVMKPLEAGETARSPGMKYRHYAPKAEMTIFTGAPDAVSRAIRSRYDAAPRGAAILSLEEHVAGYGARRVFSLGSLSHAQEAAGALFDLLREMDALGVERIYAEALDPHGIGLAVMNRMGRAAGFHIIEV